MKRYIHTLLGGTAGAVRLFASLLFCALLISVDTAGGQSRSNVVSGRVTDAAGDPMVGVTVSEPGTVNAGITNIAGEFNLSVSSQSATLMFTYVGYESQEMRVRAGSFVEVTMEDSATQIEAVVMVAYGSQKRESVTAAISSINTKDILKSSSPNLTNALAGRRSGLTALQSGGGQPGYDEATFFLRGIGTTNVANPLIMIDGVPRDNMSNLDFNEVETISVLKDASATAVFGVRGANGVLLITTKRGKVGKPQLSLSFDQSFSAFTRVPDRLHSLDYMRLRTEAMENGGKPSPFSPEMIEMYKNPLQGLDPSAPNYEQQKQTRLYMYPDNYIYGDIIRKWTPQTRLNANLSGGLDKLNYFVNVGYIRQGSNFYTESPGKLGYNPEMKVDRWSFRTNLDYTISKSVTAFLNVATYIEHINMPHRDQQFDSREAYISELLLNANSWLPITPGPLTIAGYGVEAGKPLKIPYLDRSPYDMINRTGFRQEDNTNLNTTLGINWDLSGLITKGLSIRGMISYDSYALTTLNGYKHEVNYLTLVDARTNTLQFLPGPQVNEEPLKLSRAHQSRYTINMQGSINYERDFGKNNVTAMVLGQRDYWETFNNEIPYNVIGLVGRVTYNYDTRYFIEINAGYNGSEQFAPGNRFGFFPAVSGGWIMTNEKFFTQNKWLQYLKLRTSYGLVGNDKLGSARFLYMDDITVGKNPGDPTLPSLGNGEMIYENRYGNPYLQWEVARKFNVGIDVDLLRCVKLTFDYFNEYRDKILLQRQGVPGFQGVPQGHIPKGNLGIVKNHGYEIEATFNKEVVKGLYIGARGNLSYNNNTILEYDELPRDETYSMRYDNTGYTVGQQRGYLIDYSVNGGYWTSVEEYQNSDIIYSFGDPRPGDFRYVDTNDDGIIDSRDVVPIGYSNQIPRYTYGFGVDVQWKGFDFSVFFQGVGKYSNYYGENGIVEYLKEGSYWGYTRKAWTEERWRNGEEITYPALSTNQNTNHYPNSFFIMDRSFLRLKNIELGYTLPKNALRVAGVSSMRVYVSGQNLATWSRMKAWHIDPEMNGTLDYPITRMWSFGCNITF